MGNPSVRIYGEFLDMYGDRKLLFQVLNDGFDGFPLSAFYFAGFLSLGLPTWVIRIGFPPPAAMA